MRIQTVKEQQQQILINLRQSFSSLKSRQSNAPSHRYCFGTHCRCSTQLNSLSEHFKGGQSFSSSPEKQSCRPLQTNLCGIHFLSKHWKYPMWQVWLAENQNKPPHDKTNKMACAPSQDTDQPGHPTSLISVFTVRMKKAWVLSYSLSAQLRL